MLNWRERNGALLEHRGFLHTPATGARLEMKIHSYDLLLFIYKQGNARWARSGRRKSRFDERILLFLLFLSRFFFFFFTNTSCPWRRAYDPRRSACYALRRCLSSHRGLFVRPIYLSVNNYTGPVRAAEKCAVNEIQKKIIVGLRRGSID